MTQNTEESMREQMEVEDSLKGAWALVEREIKDEMEGAYRMQVLEPLFEVRAAILWNIGRHDHMAERGFITKEETNDE